MAIVAVSLPGLYTYRLTRRILTLPTSLTNLSAYLAYQLINLHLCAPAQFVARDRWFAGNACSSEATTILPKQNANTPISSGYACLQRQVRYRVKGWKHAPIAWKILHWTQNWRIRVSQFRHA